MTDSPPPPSAPPRDDPPPPEPPPGVLDAERPDGPPKSPDSDTDQAGSQPQGATPRADRLPSARRPAASS